MNKSEEKNIGKKRNSLVKIANSVYSAFIDDDDKVSEDYIKLVIEEFMDKLNAEFLRISVKSDM